MQAVIMGGVVIAPEIVFGPQWGTVDYKTVPGYMLFNLFIY